MSTGTSGPARRIAGAGIDQERSAGRLAWEALERSGLPPTPRHYELLHTFFSGTNPQLTCRLAECLAAEPRLSEAQAAILYEECILGASDEARMVEGAGRLDAAARSLIEQVAGNRSALAGYGSALAHWAGRLDGSRGVDDLMKTVVALVTETEQASIRNMALEQQLSAAAAHITKLRQDLVEVQQAATTDSLTGLANRKAFDERIRAAVRAARAEAGGPFCLLLLDIDRFKALNDRHGHRFGDQVLRLVGRLLADTVKGRDMAARYGGEEFAIVLAEADLSIGVMLAGQICERLRSQRVVKRGSGEVVGQVTMSVGVAQHDPAEAGADLIERADQALYEAKRTGRDRVCAAPPAEGEAGYRNAVGVSP